MQLGGGPIGTLDVYAVDPRAWDDTEVRALQCLCPGGGQPARRRRQGELTGAMAQQLRVAVVSRGLIERQGGADGAQTPGCAGAFTHLRPGG